MSAFGMEAAGALLMIGEKIQTRLDSYTVTQRDAEWIANETAVRLDAGEAPDLISDALHTRLNRSGHWRSPREVYALVRLVKQLLDEDAAEVPA